MSLQPERDQNWSNGRGEVFVVRMVASNVETGERIVVYQAPHYIEDGFGHWRTISDFRANFQPVEEIRK